MSDDAFDHRNRLTFEQAEGAEPLPTQLKPKKLSKQLRALLWSVVFESLFAARSAHDRRYYFGDPWIDILRDMHTSRYHRMADEFDALFYPLVTEVKEVFEKGDYLSVFGWLQWVLRHPDQPYLFSEQIDHVLQEAGAAYRVLDGATIVPLGSEAELETIKRAFADLTATEFHGARAHLRNAATELTAGKYADSVRESIHAVESVARVLEPSGDFSKALAKLQKSVKIHGAMSSGFGSLYGYTSDANGIRHPLLDGGTAQVDETDALFMIGACAAFVSYLINKARTAGLIR